MTNLQKFKKKITAENLCDIINCCQCPMLVRNSGPNTTRCDIALKEWAKEEAK